jgi:single-stranded-DNA-specific exonuclease
VPDRYVEGYGVSSQGVDHAINQKVDLLITLDCGITACDELERATSAGIDVVVCDHHLPGESVPDVFAILDPMQADCPYTGKELCGCGVGFMLLRKVCDEMGYVDLWTDYLDLVAIATCCDIVPLKGINRILVAYGLESLREERLPGIKALLGELNHAKIDSVSDVVFKIGPRINAAGRLSHAKEAVELLLTDDAVVCKEIAARINGYNMHRKELDANATQEALEQVVQKDPDGKRASSVVFDANWNKGIIGIVASRLIESHYRPTIVLTESNGNLTGSARSVSGFNVYDAIAACSDTLEQFGGHAAAAGLTLKPDNLEAFEAAFETAVSSAVKPESIRPRIHVDADVNFADWYNDKFPQFFGQFNRFRPFGPYNMPITLMTKNVLAKDVRLLKNEHLKFKAYQPGDHKRTLDVIGFKMADYYDHVMAGKPINLAYGIEENVWNGNVSIQLQAKAIALVD